MTTATNRLDATYQARALPLGSARYFSHLFAAPPCQDPLLGLFALCAEWQALTDPSTERSVADLKLAWWQEELQRLANGTAVHPISRFLAALPGATPGTFRPLEATLRAALLEAGGVPLERQSELEEHAHALNGVPLEIVASLAGDEAWSPAIRTLSSAEYLSRSIRDYRRAAAQGKIVFAVDSLLSAGIENASLTSPSPPPALGDYLARLRGEALVRFDSVAGELPRRLHAAERHVLILAALGGAELSRVTRSRPKRALLQDMLTAWRIARRAARTSGE